MVQGFFILKMDIIQEKLKKDLLKDMILNITRKTMKETDMKANGKMITVKVME